LGYDLLLSNFLALAYSPSSLKTSHISHDYFSGGICLPYLYKAYLGCGSSRTGHLNSSVVDAWHHKILGGGAPRALCTNLVKTLKEGQYKTSMFGPVVEETISSGWFIRVPFPRFQQFSRPNELTWKSAYF